MSNHLSKSLFSIPRLKKSRSRQQNQPENPTSLCLNALTADDAFLRFAAALGEPFFSSRNPERNFIIFLCIPLPPRLFHPQKAPKRILLLTLHIPPPRALFHPRKAPKEILFLTLHILRTHAFFSPRAVPNGILFSHSTSIPPPPRPEAPALHYNIFGPVGRLSTTRGIYSPYMPNTSNDRARNALCCAETEKFSRPQTLRPPHIGAQGRPYKMNTRKNRIHRRGGGYIILGLSAGAWAAGDIIIWKYGTAESARGI